MASPPALFTLAFAALAVCSLAGCPEYGTNQLFHGKATYYGTPPMPPNTHVHCHLPNNMFGLRTVGMNKDQYDGSKSCGMCIRVYGQGNRCEGGVDPGDNSCGLGANPVEGVFDAVVTDELVERGNGDIDIGVHGDGHWGVAWHPISCEPYAREQGPRLVVHEGSNPWYAKVQARYLDSPMDTMELDGSSSQERYHDNFFIFQAGGAGFEFNDGNMLVKVRSLLGTQYCGKIDRSLQAEPHEYSMWKC